MLLLWTWPLADAAALKTVIVWGNISNQEASGPLALVSSSPYDRESLNAAPKSVSFTFSHPIRPDKSTIKVYDPTGNPVETGALEAQEKTLSVSLPELSPGKYSIKWKARCRCDEDTEIGEYFHFTVK